MIDSQQLTESEMRTELPSEMNFEVLHPENLLMIRIQKVLKERSTKRITELQDDIVQKERNIKRLRNNIENLCEIIFVQKCESRKLEAQLCDFNESVSHLIEVKDGLKQELNDLKKSRITIQASFQDTNKINKNLRLKLELQRHTLKELNNFEEDQLSKFFTKRYAMEKNKVDKASKLEEKNKQDYHLMKSENEVFRLKLLISEHKNLLDDMCHKLTILLEKVAVKDSDFTDVSSENQRLIKLWKNVVHLVSKRDETCSKLKENIESIEISYKMKTAERQSYKRSACKGMIKNEILIQEKNNKREVLNKLKQIHCNMEKKAEFLENDICETRNMVELTQKYVQKAMKTRVEHKCSLSSLEVKLINLNTKKHDLEEIMLRQLHNEVLCSNASTKLNNDIRKLRKEISHQEAVTDQLQKILYKEDVSFEQQLHCFNLEMDLLRSTKKEVDSLNVNILKFEENFRRIKLHIKQQSHNLDLDQKQLCSLEKQPLQDSTLLKDWTLKNGKLQDINKRIETEKRNWIRKQNEATLMVERKSHFILTLNAEEKHVYILHQKLNRLTHNIGKVEKENNDLEKSISRLLQQIFKLNNQHGNQKEFYSTVDNQTCTVQNTVFEKLKLSEESTATLLGQIAGLDEKKELLNKEFLKAQKDYLEWEKKLKLAEEMRDSISKEQSKNGDIGSMKNEIHRMEIRYAQLKKAQESLTCDLESSVLKRDRIFDLVIIEKKSQDLPLKPNLLIRQTEIQKSKIKKLQKTIEVLETEYSNLFSEREQTVEKLNDIERRMNTLRNSIQELDEKLSERVFLKQKNLEIIIRRQKLGDFFSQLKYKKVKCFSFNELTVERNCEKNRSMQFDLIQMLEAFRKEFPDLMNHLIRIMNVLQSVSV